MKIAFLFPGQGSQKVGMGKELAREFPAARRVFEEAGEALRFSLSRLCFEGPEEELRLTANTQPATLATSIAALRAFQSECGAAAELAAGHSLGEYSALVAAGAITLADALRAVRERGRLMQEACPAGQGTMAAILGLELAAVKALCEEVSIGGEIAVPANLNGPGQIVISGNAGAVRRALERAEARGRGACQTVAARADNRSGALGGIDGKARPGRDRERRRIRRGTSIGGPDAADKSQRQGAGRRRYGVAQDDDSGAFAVAGLCGTKRDCSVDVRIMCRLWRRTARPTCLDPIKSLSCALSRFERMGSGLEFPSAGPDGQNE